VRETVIDPRFANRERQPGLDLLRALAIISLSFTMPAFLGSRFLIACIGSAGSVLIFSSCSAVT